MGGRGAGRAGEAGAAGGAGDAGRTRRARRAGRAAGREGRGGQEGRGGRSNFVTGVNKEPTGLYRSDDAGATWRKVNNENPRPMYFSQVRVDPNDPDVVIYGGVELHMTTDGGKTVNTRRPRRRSTTTCTRSGSIRPTRIT